MCFHKQRTSGDFFFNKSTVPAFWWAGLLYIVIVTSEVLAQARTSGVILDSALAQHTSWSISGSYGRHFQILARLPNPSQHFNLSKLQSSCLEDRSTTCPVLFFFSSGCIRASRVILKYISQITFLLSKNPPRAIHFTQGRSQSL